MRHAKRNIFKTVVVLASLWLLMGFVAADIPGYVDFHAKQTSQYHPTENPLPWEILKDRYGYYHPSDAIPPLPHIGPQWELVQPGDAYATLQINNRYVPIWHKELWLEIHLDLEFAGAPFYVEPTGHAPEDVSSSLEFYDFVSGNGETKITWMWILDPQPDSETLEFTRELVLLDEDGEVVLDENGEPETVIVSVSVGELFYDGVKDSHITSIEVGTYCIPLPGSLLLCGVGLGFIGIVRRFRRS